MRVASESAKTNFPHKAVFVPASPPPCGSKQRSSLAKEWLDSSWPCWPHTGPELYSQTCFKRQKFNAKSFIPSMRHHPTQTLKLLKAKTHEARIFNRTWSSNLHWTKTECILLTNRWSLTCIGTELSDRGFEISTNAIYTAYKGDPIEQQVQHWTLFIAKTFSIAWQDFPFIARPQYKKEKG